MSGGLSGAELIAACRDAALKALEDSEDNGVEDLVVTTENLVNILVGMERQVTQKMIQFYASFNSNPVRR